MGAGPSSGKAAAQAPQYNTPEQISAAKKAVSEFNSSKKYQSRTVTRPSDGHKITIDLEKVNHTDYWGKKTGASSYTIHIYDNDEQVFYTYGADLKKAKYHMRLRLGLT